MTHHVAVARRSGATVIALALASAVFLMFAHTASAAIVTNVPMGTAANYSVLGGQSVTNAGLTTMNENLGVSPGFPAAITGFPPGIVNSPGTLDNPNAAQAQLDLTTAYDDTHLRTQLTATTGNNLAGTLQGGVYHALGRGALGITGTLILDGNNNPNSVFIFQTDSTLTTASSSVVRLIRGAQECNVYWQVLSSANLGSSSTFVGNILALTTITMQDNVTVHGRALARNGSVTLINDHFTKPTCATSLSTTTTSAAPGGVTTSTAAGGGGVTTSTAPGGGGGVTTSTPAGGGGVTTTSLGLTVGIVGPPRTGVAPLPSGSFPWPAVLFAGVGATATAGALTRRRVHARRAARAGQ
ncbi:MAG: ice-binding family protein [Actinomycetota bacterium]|nr:ice-binding family protein [Actinomycetota bacterium]